MAYTPRYTLHAITINSTVIGGISGYSLDQGIVDGVEGHDGQVDPTFGSLSAQVLENKQTVKVRTRDVYSVLNSIPIGGLALTNMVLYWQQLAQQGTRAGSSSHVKAVSSKGLAVNMGISPTHNRKVEAEFDIYLISSDGLAHPITWTTGESLSGTVSDFYEYTLGPVKNGSTVIGNTGWNFSPGYQMIHDATDGLPYPDFCSIAERMPGFTVDSPNMSAVASAAMAGGGTAAWTFFLRRLASGGTRTANATANHIKMTVPSALYYNTSQNGSHPATANAGITVKPTYNGSSDIVSWDLASAIS